MRLFQTIPLLIPDHPLLAAYHCYAHVTSLPHNPSSLPLGPPNAFISDGSVPDYGLLSLAGWGARLPRLWGPSPARQDGHAILLAQAPLWTPVGLDLLTQATLPLNHLHQLPVPLGLSLGLRCGAPTGQRVALREMGQVLVMQLEMKLLLQLLLLQVLLM